MPHVLVKISPYILLKQATNYLSDESLTMFCDATEH